MSTINVMQQALDVLLDVRDFRPHARATKAISNLRAVIAQMETVAPDTQAYAWKVGSQVITDFEAAKMAAKSACLECIPLSVIPEGYKLVPIEPTREMLDAGHFDLTLEHGIDPMLKYAWSQMLDAVGNPCESECVACVGCGK